MRRGRSLIWAAAVTALLVPTWASAQYVFYADANYPAPALRRCGPDGSNLATRALAAGTLPEGLAYDDVHRTLYWVEAAYSGARIRATDQGLSAGTTILSGLGSLRGITVDPANGWIYWTSSDQPVGARIGRANLDGTNVQVLLALPGFSPRQIAIDPVHGKIYWAEFELDAIARSNLDGSQGEFFTFLPAGSRPYGIAVNAATNELWWSEYATGLVQKLTLPPAPASSGSFTTRPADRDLEARSALMLAAARERATPLAAQAVVSGLANPSYLVLDVPGQRFFVTQAGVGATALRRANLDGTGLVTLPVAQNAFGGVAWYGSSLLDVPGGESPPSAVVALSLRTENPARGHAAMVFALPVEGEVRLDVLDTSGRRVATLAQGLHAAGVHRLTWTGETGSGRAAPGMYALRLAAGGRTLTRRFAYLK